MDFFGGAREGEARDGREVEMRGKAIACIQSESNHHRFLAKCARGSSQSHRELIKTCWDHPRGIGNRACSLAAARLRDYKLREKLRNGAPEMSEAKPGALGNQNARGATAAPRTR